MLHFHYSSFVLIHPCITFDAFDKSYWIDRIVEIIMVNGQSASLAQLISEGLFGVACSAVFSQILNELSNSAFGKWPHDKKAWSMQFSSLSLKNSV